MKIGYSLTEHVQNWLRFYWLSIRVTSCAGVFKQSMGASNQVGIGLSYWPQAWRNWFLGIDSWAPSKFKNSGSVVADSHHFDEEQDPDLHYSEKLDTDPHFK